MFINYCKQARSRNSDINMQKILAGQYCQFYPPYMKCIRDSIYIFYVQHQAFPCNSCPKSPWEEFKLPNTKSKSVTFSQMSYYHHLSKTPLACARSYHHVFKHPARFHARKPKWNNSQFGPHYQTKTQTCQTQQFLPYCLVSKASSSYFGSKIACIP